MRNIYFIRLNLAIINKKLYLGFDFLLKTLLMFVRFVTQNGTDLQIQIYY